MIQPIDFHGHPGGKDEGEAVRDVIFRPLLQRRRSFDHRSRRLPRALFLFPGFVAAALPARKIVFLNGFSIERGSHDGLDFRQAVKPFDYLPGFLAVLEALIELLADGQRQAGDFSGACHRVPLVELV
jgi:hypothetical protein